MVRCMCNMDLCELVVIESSKSGVRVKRLLVLLEPCDACGKCLDFFVIIESVRWNKTSRCANAFRRVATQ